MVKKIIRIICIIIVSPIALLVAICFLPFITIKWAFNDISIWADGNRWIDVFNYYTDNTFKFKEILRIINKVDK